MKLTINLASRGRPDLLAFTINETLARIERSDTTFVVSLDADDGATLDALLPQADCLHYDVRPREDTLGAKYNRALHYPADVYLMMVDYAPHVTPGFDQLILDAAAVFPDNIGVVYNQMANWSFPQINAITAGLAERMGFIFPPYFPYWFIDHWIDDICRMIGRIAFADVVIDTQHRPGTQELREPALWANVYDALAMSRRRCALDIIRSPGFFEAGWRKRLLADAIPLTEQRSIMINAHLRGEAHKIPTAPADERYTRTKARALDMIRAISQELDAA